MYNLLRNNSSTPRVTALAIGCFFALAVATSAQTLQPNQTAGPNDAGPGTNNPTGAGNNVQPTSGALLRDGVFGCSASKYQNIGSLSALGGSYVPVNDAAVTLNTGYLVYKECVLDGVVSAIKNSAVADLQKQVGKAISNGREGQAQYVKNIEDDLQPGETAIVVYGLSEEVIGQMCAPFKQRVQRAIAGNYRASIMEPFSILTCPFDSVEEESGSFTYGSWFRRVQPNGNIIGSAGIAEQQILDARARYRENTKLMWTWGNGFWPALDPNQNPNKQNVLTPSFTIAQSLQQLLGAGTQILVHANEIDQINGSLQAGLTSTIITDAIRGLAGLARPQNGQASYFDRMAAEAAASVRQSAVNAALGILLTAREVEGQYKAAKEAVAKALTDAIARLRTVENTCWDLIIPKVQEYASGQGASIAVATSTAFSQQIVDGQFASIASSTIRDLRVSEATIALLNQLISSVTNSSSAANQRTALERLDSMVANNQLHGTGDVQNAVKQKDEIVSALTTLVEDTVKQWGDSEDPDIGWCNINNNAVIEKWFNEWRQ